MELPPAGRLQERAAARNFSRSGASAARAEVRGRSGSAPPGPRHGLLPASDCALPWPGCAHTGRSARSAGPGSGPGWAVVEGSPTAESTAARTSSPAVMPRMTATVSRRAHSRSENRIERGSRFSAPVPSSGTSCDRVWVIAPLPTSPGHADGGVVFPPAGDTVVPTHQRPRSISAGRPRPDAGPSRSAGPEAARSRPCVRSGLCA